jgi:Icc-related predicted phosphoesterase
MSRRSAGIYFAGGVFLKLLCLSDYSGAEEILPSIPTLVQEEDPDFIFYCGGSMKGELRLAEYQMARRFHSKPSLDNAEIQKEMKVDTEYLRQFILALADTQKTIYMVPGYNDAPESTYFKTAYDFARIYPNLRPAHEMLYREDPFMVAGFGGEMSESDDEREFILQYSRPWIEFASRRLQYFTGDKILLFHSPPVCRLDVSEGEHCGVLLINEMIEKLSPKLVVCGRATSGQGMVKMGGAVIVNPGPVSKGHYAVVDFPSLTVEFKNFLG